MQADSKPGTWPAFYEAEPGHILWIGWSGSVINGAWTPTFSEDRLNCWHKPDYKFQWVSGAPSGGNYNDVISAFLRDREDENPVGRKLKSYKVAFFVQQGVLCGGPHEEITVSAVNAEAAVRKLEKEHGEGFRLCSVEEVGLSV